MLVSPELQCLHTEITPDLSPSPKADLKKGFQRAVVQQRGDCGGSKASLMLQSNVVAYKWLGEGVIWGHQSVPIITPCAQPHSTALDLEETVGDCSTQLGLGGLNLSLEQERGGHCPCGTSSSTTQ